MKLRFKFFFKIFSLFVTTISCQNKIEIEVFDYKNIELNKIDSNDSLIAITNEEYLQFGAPIAFINSERDTVIPFGKYAYFGDEILKHSAKVILLSENKLIGIDKFENRLYDVFLFDNGPDYYSNDLVRVIRNQKIGFANEFGEVVIPCKFEFAHPFSNNRAKVTFKAEKIKDLDHTMIISDEWFFIDKKGNKLNSDLLERN
ncbi:WG repeat-containing protein [Nonlabens sp. Asnod3-A02]|uniref:WG repeat-containing protein n=1 Tax=Nonlabens sp. Asnod3-A02 TaxID=3160579 RepID=UPI0038703DD5